MESINKVWPQWQVIEVLGEGGFGKVYKAKKQTFLGDEYSAIKVVKIPHNKQETEEMTSSGISEEHLKEYYYKSVLNLVDEIKLMGKLKSASHIVIIEDYEVVENKDTLGYTIFIRMELLTNIMKYYKEKEFTISEVVKMAVDILTALEYCHSQNIMHRDIKPANIFVSEFGEYKLGDFGISREVEKTNATMSQKGTKSYMAPEMIRMNKYGKNVDLYALGLTMYELLNHGRMPFLPSYPQPFFPNDREEAMFKRLNGEEFPGIEGVGELNAIIKKACHYDPKQRYQTATEMKEDLLNWTTDTIYFDKKTDNQEEKTALGGFELFEEDGKTVNVFSNKDEQTKNIFSNNEKTVNVFESKDEKTVNNFCVEQFANKDERIDNSYEATEGVFKKITDYNYVFDDIKTEVMAPFVSSTHLVQQKQLELFCEACNQRLYPIFPNVYACKNYGKAVYNSAKKTTEMVDRCIKVTEPIQLLTDYNTNKIMELYTQYRKTKSIDYLNQLYGLNPTDYHTVETIFYHYPYKNEYEIRNMLSLGYLLCQYNIETKNIDILKHLLWHINIIATFYKNVTKSTTKILQQYKQMYTLMEGSWNENQIKELFNEIEKYTFVFEKNKEGCPICGSQLVHIFPYIEECTECDYIKMTSEDQITQQIFKEYQDLIRFKQGGAFNMEPAYTRRMYLYASRDEMIKVINKHHFSTKHVENIFADFKKEGTEDLMFDKKDLLEATKNLHSQDEVICIYNAQTAFYFTNKAICFWNKKIYYFELARYKFKMSLNGNLIIKSDEDFSEVKMKRAQSIKFISLVNLIKKLLYIK